MYVDNLLLSHLLDPLTFITTVLTFGPKVNNLARLKLQGMAMEWGDFQAGIQFVEKALFNCL